MISLQKLKAAVRDGLALLKREKSLIEGTVYASANRRVVGRLVYTHHFPCQGLQEPKSDDDLGVSVQGYFNVKGKKLVGFGHIANDVSLDAVKRALERAKANAIHDPDFHGFPAPEGSEARPHRPRGGRPEPLDGFDRFDRFTAGKLTAGAAQGRPARAYVDRRLAKLAADPKAEARLLADISFKTLEGALSVFRCYHRKTPAGEKSIGGPRSAGRTGSPAAEGGLGDYIVSGDNFLVTERMALASTKGIRVWDESTIVMSLVSAMVERQHAKGRGWGAASGLGGFDPAAAGQEAAEQAVRGVGGGQIATGTYTVVLGPQAAAEIFSNLLLHHFSAADLDFRLSIFNGRFGDEVASPLLTLSDDGTYQRGPGSKTVTDDGYHAARVPLIEAGRFVGLLQNDYYQKKLLAQSDALLGEKVGRGAREYLHAHIPRSGFRFGGGGGRMASHEPGISATNLFISSAEPLSRRELLGRVRNGIYIGALWYTYPIAGAKAGEISGTAVADTFRIQNGKLAEPLRVNSIRIHANLRDIAKNIIGITAEARPTVLWASDEITYAPEVGISNVHLEAIKHESA